jgi:hypothetical protein
MRSNSVILFFMAAHLKVDWRSPITVFIFSGWTGAKCFYGQSEREYAEGTAMNASVRRHTAVGKLS